MTRRVLSGFSLAAAILCGGPAAALAQPEMSDRIPVFTDPGAIPRRPAVAAWAVDGGGCPPDGGDCAAFVVAWEQADPEPRIFAQVFDPAGGPIGELILVGEGTAPSVAAGAEGDFVVARRAANGDLYWDWFDTAGLWRGGEEVRLGLDHAAGAAVDRRRADAAPSIDVTAISRDRYAVAWDLFLDGAPRGAFLHLFGERSGLLQLETPGRADRAPRVSMVRSGPCVDAGLPPTLPAPCLVVAWHGGAGEDVFVRAFSRDLTPVELADPFNLVTTGVQSRPAVAASEDGFTVVWESRSPSGPIDLAVCLDGSGSIAPHVFERQKDGLIAALNDPSIIPRDGSVRMVVSQFADETASIHKPLTVVSEATAGVIAGSIGQATRLEGPTCLACCIEAATDALAGPPDPAVRKVILLATDGLASESESPGASDFESERAAIEAAENARASGVDALNAIAVGGEPIWLDLLRRLAFAEPADGGCEPGSAPCEHGFVVKAGDSEDFTDAVRRTIVADPDSTGAGIFARQYAAENEGGPLGPEFQVNTFFAGDQSSPDLAAGSEGDLLAVWEDHQQRQIAAQSIGSDGSLRGEEIVLAGDCSAETFADAEDGPQAPRVAGLSDGRYVMVWTDGTEHSSRGLFARLFRPEEIPPCESSVKGMRRAGDPETGGAAGVASRRASERGGPTVFYPPSRKDAEPGDPDGPDLSFGGAVERMDG